MSLEQMGDRVAVAQFLRELLNRLCRRVGLERSYCFTLGGVWNQRFLGSHAEEIPKRLAPLAHILLPMLMKPPLK